MGQGRPTVILESGWGGMIGDWRVVQERVAAITRVCSYNRAGHGSSDPGPMPRTAQRIAEELHSLLGSAGEAQPFLLVGQSLGGYYVRVFRARFGSEVAAMVLVDATQEDQNTRLPPKWQAIIESMTHRAQAQAAWPALYVDSGFAHLFFHLQGKPAPQAVLRSAFLRARAGEAESLRVSAEQARAAGLMGDTPLLVLTAGKSPDPEYHRVWVDDLQPRLSALSRRGRRVMVPDSSHDIVAERRDAVVDAVRDLVAAVRQLLQAFEPRMQREIGPEQQ